MQMAHYGMMPQLPPIINKEYNINVGVSGSQVNPSLLFEDSLPIKNVMGTFCSLGERLIMYEAIRASIFPSGDGTNEPIDVGSRNMLSYLKIMDMNPYNVARFTKNPYRGLAYGFLLFRSCYPIRFNNRVGSGPSSAICASNSTGMNIRIYRLTEGAFNVNKQCQTKMSDYDEWRDIAFYNFIKEDIIKKKVCPNFAIMYGYNIVINSYINFDDLRATQDKGPQFVRETDVPLINNVTNPMQSQDVNMNLVPKQTVINTIDPVTGQRVCKFVNVPTQEEELAALNKYTGKALVCITESANYNIMGWAKKEYKSNGNITTMINSGFHEKNVWESVIFQILAALYVMQLKGIIINNFKLDRNVFIKDISTGGGGNVTNYWIYKIQGIEYFVPNYGYLVLIDTNFRDYEEKSCGNDVVSPTRVRKLDGSFVSDNKLTDIDVMEKVFAIFKTVVDPNNFDQAFVNDGGVKPSESILQLLTQIKNHADQKKILSIAFYIRHYMTMFLHNRIGTPLTIEAELKHVKKNATKEFRKGQMVVVTDTDGIDKFAIFINYIKGKDGVANIIIKSKLNPNMSTIIEDQRPLSTIYEYAVTETVKQEIKMNQPTFSEETLLETYVIE
jgi:hypothetical protein